MTARTAPHKWRVRHRLEMDNPIRLAGFPPKRIPLWQYLLPKYTQYRRPYTRRHRLLALKNHGPLRILSPKNKAWLLETKNMDGKVPSIFFHCSNITGLVVQPCKQVLIMDNLLAQVSWNNRPKPVREIAQQLRRTTIPYRYTIGHQPQ